MATAAVTKITSRIANAPVALAGSEVKLSDDNIEIKGAKGTLSMSIHPAVTVSKSDSEITFGLKKGHELSDQKFVGTMRALANNMVTGVTQGFEKKLELNGTGYRASVAGNILDLTLGFSHPVKFEIPEGITIECPSQKDIVIKGIDKQKVGQTAANIIAWRPEEPYKGKGVIDPLNRRKRKEVKKQ